MSKPQKTPTLLNLTNYQLKNQNPKEQKQLCTPYGCQHYWSNVLDTKGDNAEDYHHRPKFTIASEAKQNDNER